MIFFLRKTFDLIKNCCGCAENAFVRCTVLHGVVFDQLEHPVPAHLPHLPAARVEMRQPLENRRRLNQAVPREGIHYWYCTDEKVLYFATFSSERSPFLHSPDVSDGLVAGEPLLHGAFVAHAFVDADDGALRHKRLLLLPPFVGHPSRAVRRNTGLCNQETHFRFKQIYYIFGLFFSSSTLRFEY